MKPEKGRIVFVRIFVSQRGLYHDVNTPIYASSSVGWLVGSPIVVYSLYVVGHFFESVNAHRCSHSAQTGQPPIAKRMPNSSR